MEKKKLTRIILIAGAALVAVALVAAIVIWNINVFAMDLTMTGDAQITLEYGSDYTDAGATAQFYGTILVQDPECVEVTAEGTVDTATVGTYTITYTASRWGVTQVCTRTVHVVDTQKPQLTLTADPDTFTLPGQEYVEEGFVAWDDYDGDITHKVVRTVGDGEVVYCVADSSGNAVEVKRQIVYNDPVVPELTLLGDTKITVPAGGSFKEPGFTASDNCDGDITEWVQVSGGIDPYLPGSYTIEYSVTDSYGNTATASRTVTVGGIYNNGGTNGKVIYLTFDDGPSNYTPYLLDILKKYGVKATFFVVNTGAISTIARTAREGHTIAIHSKTHDYKKIYASEDAYFEDLYAMQQIIYNHTGITTCMVRFPGGSSNRVSSFNPGIMTRLTQALGEQGFYYFDWNVSSEDAGVATTTDEVFNNVIKGIGKRSTSVVLQHDSQAFSVRAVEKIIVWGLVHGYTFLPMNPSSPGCHHAIRN